MVEVSKIRISKEWVQSAMQSDGVRKQLKSKADEVADRARIYANADGVDMDIEVQEGTRPGGRPFADVRASNVAQEFGDDVTPRFRILGRAAERA